MTFFRMTAPLHKDTSSAATGEPSQQDREGLFARMFRLWVEHHERVVQFRLLDQ